MNNFLEHLKFLLKKEFQKGSGRTISKAKLQRLKGKGRLKSSWPQGHPSGYIKIEQGGKFESNRRKF